MRILNTYTEFVPPDDPRTADEIRDLCCTDVPFDPCAKTGRVSDYQGAEQEDWDFDPDQLLEQARADNPGKRILSVRVEGIGNRPGKPCGKKYESWTGRNNCCDFVEPMAWDTENSAEVVAPGSRAVVGITGGAPPFYVSIRGEGFTLDGYRIRDGWVDTRLFWVYAGPYACGWAPIEVSDGCSIVKHGIRSTEGEWVLQDDFSPSCEVQNAEVGGLFLCSAYGPSRSGPYRCVDNGEYWTGPDNLSPGDDELIWYARDSHICGLWASYDGPDTIWLTAPGSDGNLAYPMLHSFGVSGCVLPGGGSVTAKLYWWATNARTYRWRC